MDRDEKVLIVKALEAILGAALMARPIEGVEDMMNKRLIVALQAIEKLDDYGPR